MDGADDALRVLRAMDDKLLRILELLSNPPQVGPARLMGTPVQEVASAADLDGKYGDPEIVAKSPRDWTGDDMKGLRFSECPADYLDLVAARLDYFAGDNESKGDTQKARYNKLDAARARGWAKRIRAGYKPPRRERERSRSSFDDGDEPPF